MTAEAWHITIKVAWRKGYGFLGFLNRYAFPPTAILRMRIGLYLLKLFQEIFVIDYSQLTAQEIHESAMDKIDLIGLHLLVNDPDDGVRALRLEAMREEVVAAGMMPSDDHIDKTMLLRNAAWFAVEAGETEQAENLVKGAALFDIDGSFGRELALIRQEISSMKA